VKGKVLRESERCKNYEKLILLLKQKEDLAKGYDIIIKSYCYVVAKRVRRRFISVSSMAAIKNLILCTYFFGVEDPE
jgi:hypothetical protein